MRGGGIARFAIELSALSEPEVKPLVEFLEASRPLSFNYISVHAPSKDLTMKESDRVQWLFRLGEHADAIVIHPDTIRDVEAYQPLGRRLVIENMDARKPAGRTPAELEQFFVGLPEAGFCFDVAHAWSIDKSMAVASDLLEAFANRLRHVHLSSLSADDHHVTLRNSDAALFEQVLDRCRDVPWILEAPMGGR
jgi:Xylose isomerase-like TIM barrel.